MENNFILVFCTCPKGAISDSISEAIVKSKAGACVNKVNGVLSTFLWENKLNKLEEDLLIIKTTMNNYEKLSNIILKEHPYDCPEIIALPIIKGHTEYLSWVKDQCNK